MASAGTTAATTTMFLKMFGRGRYALTARGLVPRVGNVATNERALKHLHVPGLRLAADGW